MQEYSGNAGLANMASYANNASGDLLDIITDLQEQVAALQNNNANNNNAELLQTIEAFYRYFANYSITNQVNDVYNATPTILTNNVLI